MALPGVQREGDPQHLRIEENQGEAMAPAEREVMQMALETAEQIASADYRHWEELASLGEFERWARSRANHIAEALRTALAQPDVPESCCGETEPVAMKFQIYKQTPPRGRELEPINSALLPWVCDQDPSSGNTASMWVTPVATLPSQQREWVGLTDDEYELMAEKRVTNYFFNTLDYAHDIEAKLKEKNT